jgi:hypothetical protein
VRHMLRVMTAAVLNQFPTVFDTHMVEKITLRHYPVAFAQELVRFGHTSDPWHQFSAHYAKWIHKGIRGSNPQNS